ncbi:MAG: hypothetical protein N2253_00555 [Bacteroidia bacterium]|nr:hypothetical protein [Bacteroidia bacterium]
MKPSYHRKRERSHLAWRRWDFLILGGRVFTQLVGIFSLAYAQGKQALYAKAQLYMQRRQWDSALSVWRPLLFVERDSGARALVYQQLGVVALYRGDSAAALRLWKLSLTYKPEYQIAQRNYQWLYQKLSRPVSTSLSSRSPYEPQDIPSEQAKPHIGSGNPSAHKKVLWLPLERF